MTDTKIPVVDTLKNFEDPGEPGSIDNAIFASSVLEQAFKLADTMTRNMISVFVRRYDTDMSVKFNYNIFLSDLEVLELANPTTIRIFKTQNEINFFQRTAATDDIDGVSFHKNRNLIEPLKEPAYEAKTIKNTFYEPPVDEF